MARQPCPNVILALCDAGFARSDFERYSPQCVRHHLRFHGVNGEKLFVISDGGQVLHLDIAIGLRDKARFRTAASNLLDGFEEVVLNAMDKSEENSPGSLRIVNWSRGAVVEDRTWKVGLDRTANLFVSEHGISPLSRSGNRELLFGGETKTNQRCLEAFAARLALSRRDTKLVRRQLLFRQERETERQTRCPRALGDAPGRKREERCANCLSELGNASGFRQQP